MDPSYLEDDGHSTPSPPPQPGSSRDQDHTEWLRKQRDIWQRHYQAIKWHYQIAVGNAQQPFEPPDEFREYQIRAHYHICRRLNQYVSYEKQRKLWHLYTLIMIDRVI